QEAELTAARLNRLGIEAHILDWVGGKPKSGVMTAARQARYALLDQWCRKKGVLHLLVAHHADDQAETFLMRLGRGSGPDGLAAMASVRELSACRLLRPLLDFPKARLQATLRALDIDWVEDPSNVDPKYARSRLRAQMRSSGTDVMGIVRAARRFARARAALENHTSAWLARHAVLDQAGFIVLDDAQLQIADEEIRLRILGRTAMTVGGRTYSLQIASLERLASALAGGRGATLGSARFVVQGDTIGIYREARNLPEAGSLVYGSSRWDHRFIIKTDASAAGTPIQPWSSKCDKSWPEDARPTWFKSLPDAARAGLPVIGWAGAFSVPKPGSFENIGVSIRFQPTMPVSGGGFTVA
ncbi:MAG: tRNA lysidine(34) synthetase TilS, partial [Rhodospirillales bacterium]